MTHTKWKNLRLNVKKSFKHRLNVY
jgi:hypothetical protein